MGFCLGSASLLACYRSWAGLCLVQSCCGRTAGVTVPQQFVRGMSGERLRSARGRGQIDALTPQDGRWEPGSRARQVTPCSAFTSLRDCGSARPPSPRLCQALVSSRSSWLSFLCLSQLGARRWCPFGYSLVQGNVLREPPPRLSPDPPPSHPRLCTFLSTSIPYCDSRLSSPLEHVSYLLGSERLFSTAGTCFAHLCDPAALAPHLSQALAPGKNLDGSRSDRFGSLVTGSQPPSAKPAVSGGTCPCSLSYFSLWVVQEGKGPVWLAPVLRESHGSGWCPGCARGGQAGGRDRPSSVCDQRTYRWCSLKVMSFVPSPGDTKSSCLEERTLDLEQLCLAWSSCPVSASSAPWGKPSVSAARGLAQRRPQQCSRHGPEFSDPWLPRVPAP
ncbi:uncharacterized protein LOC117802067 [Ailuropoda melanoleuca]|uniref:uncharacterized protein LOC117802067 n=1 Tax=Ailuropoda melanoleuca TaxID=9646 RepID=UPI0014949116|nr:uncharacterized protein LOC117802067 [Ailuropoda melanoleuca]